MRNKKLLVAAGALAAMTIAGAAFAYFTNNGTGSGQAGVGTSSVIELSSPVDGSVGTLYPDGADVPVTVTIHNPGQGSQYVGTISGVVNTNDNGTASDATDDCLGTWFQVDSISYNKTLAAGATDTASTVVRMKDSGGNQDACKLDTVSITWSSN